jgi:hypothetical protein
MNDTAAVGSDIDSAGLLQKALSNESLAYRLLIPARTSSNFEMIDTCTW